MPAEAHEAYLTALLMSINGWASWCAYQRWQARLEQRDDAQIVHLLAVRLAWEWLLHEGHPGLAVADKLSVAWRTSNGVIEQAESALQHDWLWQAALERSYQSPLCQGLMTAQAPIADSTAPAVQAVFCIDVRSEVFRRALEATSPTVQTLGFAGFFAMFVEYRPLGSDMVRPQLPGLLAPGLCITDECDECDAPGLAEVLADRRKKNLLWRQQWQSFRGGAGSTFSFVESCGLLYAGKLLKRSFGAEAAPPTVEQTGLTVDQRNKLRPRLPSRGGPDLEARVSSAATALSAMGLTTGYARLILMAGHGSTSANNPHAAGLDCGACGGQTGEVNARVLSGALNDNGIRKALHSRGISVPASTLFVAGLHNSTTDAVVLHEPQNLPASHNDAVQQMLNGRSFLHDYRTKLAPTLGVLELIMTAPMVVTNWINLQYHASTVDNRRHGCGNKVLHNVGGGHLGVFEGNGGDLRIGLPKQSPHVGWGLSCADGLIATPIAGPKAEPIAGLRVAHPATELARARGLA